MKIKLPPKLSFGEELGNVLSHAIPCLAVLIMFPIITIIAYTQGSVRDVVGVTIFSISLFWMFLCSALYHLMPYESRHKEIMRLLDHISIYIAIAGTYTPICLTVIGGWQAILLLVVQWVLVLSGILFKVLGQMRLPKVSVAIYLIMGWTVLIILPTFWVKADPALFWLILAGGLCYSGGVVSYALKNIKYSHMIWHLFVLAGSVCHYIGICFFMY